MGKTKTYWKPLKLNERGQIVSGFDGSVWNVGKWRTVPAPTEECIGLNCSEYIADAMGYVEMAVLAEVEIAGAIITGDNKITSEKMRILHAYRWEKKDSVAFAVYAAGLVVENFERAFPKDKRVHQTIEIVKKYLTDPSSVTEDELRSASESAESAAEFAAWSAAESAWSAAWSAAESAARSARSAAWSAWFAARSAESAESAARSARKKIKNTLQAWIITHISELKEITE